MESTLRLRIADHVASISVPRNVPIPPLVAPFRCDIRDPGEDAVAISFEPEEDADRQVDRLGAWVRRRGGVDNSRLIQLWQLGWLAFLLPEVNSERHWVLWMTSKATHLDMAMESCLRVYWSHAVPREAGIFVHGCAVRFGNEVSLFLGVSGVGKTTFSKLAQSRKLPVLSDERVFLQRGESEYVAHSTPFGRICDGPLQGKVSSVFFLEHASTGTEFERLRVSEALAIALRDEPYTARSFRAADRRLAFEHLADLFSSVPCYRMKFVPNSDSVDLVAALVRDHASNLPARRIA